MAALKLHVPLIDELDVTANEHAISEPEFRVPEVRQGVPRPRRPDDHLPPGSLKLENLWVGGACWEMSPF